MADDKFSKFVNKPKKDGKSFVWTHFGHLCSTLDGRTTDINNVYCIECFKEKVLKVYKDTVSTTNLSQHLRDSHSILNNFAPHCMQIADYSLIFFFLI